MSDAKKCDRCGAFYETYDQKIIIKKDTGLRIITMDLCPVCQDSIESWLTLKPKEAKDEPEEEQSSRNDNI